MGHDKKKSAAPPPGPGGPLPYLENLVHPCVSESGSHPVEEVSTSRLLELGPKKPNWLQITKTISV